MQRKIYREMREQEINFEKEKLVKNTCDKICVRTKRECQKRKKKT